MRQTLDLLLVYTKQLQPPPRQNTQSPKSQEPKQIPKLSEILLNFGLYIAMKKKKNSRLHLQIKLGKRLPNINLKTSALNSIVSKITIWFNLIFKPYNLDMFTKVL